MSPCQTCRGFAKADKNQYGFNVFFAGLFDFCQNQIFLLGHTDKSYCQFSSLMFCLISISKIYKVFVFI